MSRGESGGWWNQVDISGRLCGWKAAEVGKSRAGAGEVNG